MKILFRRALAKVLLQPFVVAAVVLVLSPGRSFACDSANTQRIANLSTEELMNVEVVSVAKKPQKFGDTAAMITVISK